MRSLVVGIALALCACGSSPEADDAGPVDAGSDGGATVLDAGDDGGGLDAGDDGGALDAGAVGTDGGPSDAGPSGADAGPSDASIADAGSRDGGSGPPPMVVGTGRMLSSLSPADFSCRGSRTAPAGSGAPIAYTGVVRDYFNGELVAGLDLHFFANDLPTAACGSGCLARTTDAAGTVALSDVAGSWSADRVLAGTYSVLGSPRDYVEVLQYHVTTPAAGGSVELAAVQRSTLNTIITLLGVMASLGDATLIGTLVDCTEAPIANAQVRLFDASGEIPLGTGRSGPRGFYFNGSAFPAAAQRATHIDGLFGATNVPAGSRLRVELWGSLAGGPAELLGCEAVEGIPDGMTLIDVGPRRADGPSDCSP